MIYLLCSSHQSPCTSNLCVREIHPGLKPSAEGSKWINPHFLFDALGVSHFLCHPNLKYRENRQNVECDQDLEKKKICLFVAISCLLRSSCSLLDHRAPSHFHTSHSARSSSLHLFFFLSLSLLPNLFPLLTVHTHTCSKAGSQTAFSSIHSLSLSHTPPSYLSLCGVYFFGFGNARFSKRTSLLLEENKLKLHFHL